jgi:NADH-quinone oxidoreductase subunit D
LWLGTHALDIGAMSVFFYCWQDRDRILEIKEHLSGVRTKTSWICPGGLRGDAPTGWMTRVKEFLDYFPERIALYETLLTNNPIWIERTRGVGVISAEDAIAFGMGGPSLRASGVNLDLRKTNPYSSYEQFDFDVAVGNTAMFMTDTGCASRSSGSPSVSAAKPSRGCRTARCAPRTARSLRPRAKRSTPRWSR